MKKLWQYLREHVQEDFRFAEYTSIAAFLAICIAFNYTFDFEDSFLDLQTGLSKFLYYLLTHAVAYLVPVFLIHFFSGKSLKLTSGFWLRSLLLLTLISLDRSNLLLEHWVYEFFHHQVSFLVYKVLNNLSGLIYIILPLLLFYLLRDRHEQNFYGLTRNAPDLKPYFVLLLIMLPIIATASFLPGFQKQYPMYESTQAHLFLQIPEWVTVALYETAYALNFVSIEFFYRGFLVIGMAVVLGRSAILPMASLYCFLHFGKPMPEAISSIFGGYILGVIALETRSIWGGILVHVGIAWTMELIAYLQELVN
ncbi:MAG: CPBP family intramembrane metalloprotease [Cyclobacteriaceae bacterium]|nr:CPBP family intramembrane metalloprotease [Cyclobacteriaceae bacterium]